MESSGKSERGKIRNRSGYCIHKKFEYDRALILSCIRYKQELLNKIRETRMRYYRFLFCCYIIAKLRKIASLFPYTPLAAIMTTYVLRKDSRVVVIALYLKLWLTCCANIYSLLRIVNYIELTHAAVLAISADMSRFIRFPAEDTLARRHKPPWLRGTLGRLSALSMLTLEKLWNSLTCREKDREGRQKVVGRVIWNRNLGVETTVKSRSLSAGSGWQH